MAPPSPPRRRGLGRRCCSSLTPGPFFLVTVCPSTSTSPLVFDSPHEMKSAGASLRSTHSKNRMMEDFPESVSPMNVVTGPIFAGSSRWGWKFLMEMEVSTSDTLKCKITQPMPRLDRLARYFDGNQWLE